MNLPRSTLALTLTLAAPQLAARSPEPVPQARPDSSSRGARATSRFYIGGTFAYLDLLIPSKKGLTLGLTQHADSLYEAEYLTGSIALPFSFEDLGSFSETRFSLLSRRFLGFDSFHLFGGLAYHAVTLELGDDQLERSTGGVLPRARDLQVESLGVAGGLGNRWQWTNGLTLGVDWLTWSQPIWIFRRSADYQEVVEDRARVDAALRWMMRFPRLSIAKLQAGYSF